MTSSPSDFASFDKVITTTQNIPDLTFHFLFDVCSIANVPFLLLIAISTRSLKAILHFLPSILLAQEFASH
jgi:hypothetical protein